MKKPILVIMAAGMGSRYGGLKQIDPVDEDGHIIIDFSLFDARRAGFDKVIFIIKREDDKLFRETVGSRMEKFMDVSYAYQDMDNIPDGFEVPDRRSKPWGTAHAVLSAAPQISGPFAVINADDYYGYHALQAIYDYLTHHCDGDKYRYAMIGYHLKNTVTENGYVARGICTVDSDNYLLSITERTMIAKTEAGIAYSEDNGISWAFLNGDSLVSMNMWGFTYSIVEEIRRRFPDFLAEQMKKNPLKCEFFLPSVVGSLIAEQRALVEVLESEDKWYGVTYKEDKPTVMRAISNLKEAGVYPRKLWEEN